MSYFIFPLRQRTTSYKNSPGRFGNPRSGNTRTHAGCDLYAPEGTEILAMADGTVIEGPRPFYENVYELRVKHDNGMVVRYGEIKQNVPRGIRVGARVSKGQVIAYVGKIIRLNLSMLHLEMYKGDRSGQLTQAANRTYHYCPQGNYQRRSDLLDPTDILDHAPMVDEEPSPDGNIGTVNAQVTTNLNVRSQPQLSAPVQFTLRFGETCIVLEKVTGDTYSHDQNQWCKIYKDGKTGFAAAVYIDVTEQPEEPSNLAKGRVNNHVQTVLNVRSQAATTAPILFELSPGATCTILQGVTGSPYPPNNQTQWYQIQQGGQTGYAAAYYIDKFDENNPPQVLEIESAEGRVNHRVSSTLNVRSQPNTNSNILFTLSTGTTFKVLEEVSGSEYDFGRTDWLKIDYNNQQGYVAAHYVDINLDPPPASRWDQALMQAPTTGASAATASQDGLSAGVQSSHKMAQTDLQRVKAMADCFCTAAAKFGVPAALLAAVASRESRGGNILNAQGWGDCHGGQCYGFGIMQVDKRSHTVEGIPDGPKSLAHVEQATGIFANCLQQVQQKHPNWEDRYVIKGAAVAYNSGLRNVQTKEGMDIGTTGNDYGSDVMARAQYYANHADLSVFRISL
ncbi:SH3 domain-containing protein [Microcystis aeruginosa]|uniref:SH3 domain-containing protein n=1 Tax=Microcystis aeruginosa TaxID=1126 RepID=UPI00232F2854|nr:SH3 domain-containing protein [Microcystis aeruginosa]MDB9432096.1 SH3 domain-containing protein [Microcystis aeruginosa CS-552/01]